MGQRETFDKKARAQINALPVAAPDVPEKEHFFTCQQCGQRVDYRRLGDVLYHDEPHSDPLPPEEPWEPTFIEPMLPLLVDSAPEGDGWLHEIKYDGYRTQLHIRHGDGRAFTRNGHDWSHLYRLILDRALDLDCESAVLDGEVIIQKEDGTCDFHGLRRAIQKESDALLFMAFDLLELDGRDLRRQPIERRRDLLLKLIGASDPKSNIQFSAHVVGNGAVVFDAADKMGLEGIVSKRMGGKYRSGRSDAWLKTKSFVEELLKVVGTETGGGAPVALLAREEEGKLVYAGGAMVTLRQPERDRFWKAVERLSLPTPPLKIGPRKGARWVRPNICVRVRTLRGEEKLRHATILSIASILK